jgi:hypothetical protein
MMAPTSDERREVAERVRKTHGIMAFVDALGIDVDSDWCWTDVSRRVAGLIDPTCGIEPMPSYVPSHLFYRWRCDACGAVCFVPLYVMRPSYCPNCGARLVTRDGHE